ncbi:MAG: hypothetical protein ACTSWX_09345 [Promethearchaeota archaeon]
MKPIDIYQTFGNFFKIRIEFSETSYSLFWYPPTIDRDFTDNEYIFDHSTRGFYSFIKKDNAIEKIVNLKEIRNLITKQFVYNLKLKNYIFKGKYRFYHLKDEIKQRHSQIFRIFNGSKFRFYILQNDLFLVLDPNLIINFEASIYELIKLGINPETIKNFSVRYKNESTGGIDGYLIETKQQEQNNSEFYCKVKDYKSFEVIDCNAKHTYPESRPELIQKFLNEMKLNFNVITLQRKESFLSSKTASLDRFQRTLDIINELKNEIFPITFGSYRIDLESDPIIVKG